MSEYKFLKKWEHPKDYFGETYYDYYVVIGRHRDSNLLANHNYEVAWKMLQNELDKLNIDNEELLICPNFSHWAVGWVQGIMVRQDAPSSLLRMANDLLKCLEDYPIFNEDEYWDAVWKEQERIWHDLSLRERVQLCIENNANIFAARHDDYWPEELDEVLEQWAME